MPNNIVSRFWRLAGCPQPNVVVCTDGRIELSSIRGAMPNTSVLSFGVKTLNAIWHEAAPHGCVALFCGPLEFGRASQGVVESVHWVNVRAPFAAWRRVDSALHRGWGLELQGFHTCDLSACDAVYRRVDND